MLAILMKRSAQHAAPQAVTLAASTVASNISRPSLADKPWEDTQQILKQDVSYLRTLSGSKEKDPFKQALIEKYRPLIQKLLQTHKGNYGNLDVMWHWFLWHVDLGKLETIHDEFRLAIDGGLDTPSSWKMDGQTAFLGYVFKYSHEAYKANKGFNREYLTGAVLDLQKGELATNVPLKVKIFRLVGDWHYEDGNRKEAHDLFELVMKLDPNKGGCKGKLKELKQELGYDQPD